MSIWSTRRLRWLVPGVVTLLVVGGAATARALVGGEPETAPRTTEALLAELRAARPVGFSGTVVLRCELGLPVTATAAPGGAPQLGALLSGSHTLRIWYAGQDRFRVAVLGTLGQSDLIRDGSDLWLWESVGNRATRLTLPPIIDQLVARIPGLAVTPHEAAWAALDALEPTTELSTDHGTRVAGRAAYELVLTPRVAGTTVREVRLAVDAEHHLPLRVQVYGQAADPAIEVRFTQIDFAQPDPEQFRFNPPPGVEVTEPDLGSMLRLFADRSALAEAGLPKVTLAGEGWTSVLVIRLPGGPDKPDLAALRSLLPQVSGDWGSGRLLTGSLVNALLTDDGWLLLGAVPPERLTEVATEAVGRSGD